MARTIVCDLCKEEEAMALYSTMADGTTLAIGKNCGPQFAYGLAVAVGVLPDPAAEPAEPETPPKTNEEWEREDVGESAPEPPKRRPRRSQPAE